MGKTLEPLNSNNVDGLKLLENSINWLNKVKNILTIRNKEYKYQDDYVIDYIIYRLELRKVIRFIYFLNIYIYIIY